MTPAETASYLQALHNIASALGGIASALGAMCACVTWAGIFIAISLPETCKHKG